jgi:hypothetical protein
MRQSSRVRRIRCRAECEKKEIGHIRKPLRYANRIDATGDVEWSGSVKIAIHVIMAYYLLQCTVGPLSPGQSLERAPFHRVHESPVLAVHRHALARRVHVCLRGSCPFKRILLFRLINKTGRMHRPT